MHRAPLPDGVLDKVRALLAKAESTSFDGEAEAFTAKAQELITRYRIEHVLLETSSMSSRDPSSRRILVPRPYAMAKALLLATIADVNGCAAVWSKDACVTTVFGYPAELDAVDALFASLLVQAAGALRHHGAKVDALGRSRTKSFRRSFLLSFAARIGKRLEDAVTVTVLEADVDPGTDLAVVLADRASAARTAADTTFPGTRSFGAVATNGEGWYAGRVFADQVDLTTGARLCA